MILSLPGSLAAAFPDGKRCGSPLTKRCVDPLIVASCTAKPAAACVTTGTTMLTESALKEALSDLPDWKVEGNTLVKKFAFPSYLEGIAFVNRLASAAERANHHPDLEVNWRKVTVKLTTHSAGGITPLDIALAHEAERATRAPVTAQVE